MTMDRHERIISWLRKKKVAPMRLMQHQFQVSRATILRRLNEHGYFSSYNHNASYYALREVPEFDDDGLWAFKDVRFSKFGTLSNTIVALVEKTRAGRTVAELEEQLETKVANLLCRLVQEERLAARTLSGRRAVYVAADPTKAERQFQRREQMLAARTEPEGLPPGLDAEEVIQILRQMVASDAKPELLARQLARRGVPVTAGQVRKVIDHYALKKNAAL